jgi:hypothetical protein
VDELRAALRASRLLSSQQVDSLPDVPAGSPLDGRSWADGLVADGVLTSFQVSAPAAWARSTRLSIS